jgi:hypothetical protein
VKEKGLTLSGARQRLRQNKEGTMQQQCGKMLP